MFHHSLEAHLEHIDKTLEILMATAQELQVQVDRLAAAVAALKPPTAALITQEQLDANTASVTDSAAKVEAVNGPMPTPTA